MQLKNSRTPYHESVYSVPILPFFHRVIIASVNDNTVEINMFHSSVIMQLCLVHSLHAVT